MAVTLKSNLNEGVLLERKIGRMRNSRIRDVFHPSTREVRSEGEAINHLGDEGMGIFKV